VFESVAIGVSCGPAPPSCSFRVPICYARHSVSYVMYKVTARSPSEQRTPHDGRGRSGAQRRPPLGTLWNLATKLGDTAP